MASTGELPEDARVAKPAEDIHSLHLSRDSAYQSLGPVDLRQTLPEPDSVQGTPDIDVEAQFRLEFDYSFLQELAANTEPAKFFESELHQSQFDESFYSDYDQIPIPEADDLLNSAFFQSTGPGFSQQIPLLEDPKPSTTNFKVQYLAQPNELQSFAQAGNYLPSKGDIDPEVVEWIRSWMLSLPSTEKIWEDDIKSLIQLKRLKLSPDQLRKLIDNIQHEQTFKQRGHSTTTKPAALDTSPGYHYRETVARDEIDQSLLLEAAEYLSKQPTRCPNSGTSFSPLSSSRKFQCDACKRTFELKDVWKKHMYSRYPCEGYVCDIDTTVVINGTLQCSVCGLENPDMNHFPNKHPGKITCLHKPLGKGKVFHSRDLYVNHLKNIHPGIPFAPFVSRNRFEVEPKFDKECKDCNYHFKGHEDWINHLAEKAIARASESQAVSRRNKTLPQSHEDSVSEHKESECLEDTSSIPHPLGRIAPEESPENGPCSFTRSRPILNHKLTPHEPLASPRKAPAWKTSQKGQKASPFPISNEMANQRHFLTAPSGMSNKHPTKEDPIDDTKGIMDALRNFVPAWKKWPVPNIMKTIKDCISIIPVPSRKSTQHNKTKVSASSFRISKSKHKPVTRPIQISRGTVSAFHPEDIEDSRDGSLKRDTQTTLIDYLLEAGMSRGDCLKRDTQATLKDCLLSARISKNDNQFYIPVDASSKLISHQAIVKELQVIYPEDSPEACKDLAFNILGGRQKLFGILAIIGKLSTIKDLLAEKLCDQDLPLRLANSSTAGTNAMLHKIESTTGRSLQVFSPWTAWELDEFRRIQWSFLAPVFGTGNSHYNFEQNVILPFEVTDDHFHQGGFSTVFSARVHPAHQAWENIYAEDSKKGPMIAIKQLFSADEREFKKEKSILQKLSKQNHPHIIKLLATYQQKNLYNLIFPLAGSNLRQYWADEKPKFDFQTVSWFAKQCKGMAEALAAIHNFKATDPLMNSRLPKHHEGKLRVPQGEELFGRHGDIKPENILWFKSPGGNGTDSLGVLQIADFGLGRFHGRDSRSRMDAKRVGFTPTYAPPELELEKPISRKYDVWSLGCLYLEFTTWLLRGGAEVEAFANARAESNLMGIQDDCFYSIRPPEEGKERSAIVRVGVARWFERLRKSPRCSGLLQDFLHLIETELLVVDPHQRIQTTDLVTKLEEIMDKAKTDPKYLVQPDISLGDGVGVQIEKRPRSNSQSSCESHAEKIKRRRVCEGK